MSKGAIGTISLIYSHFYWKFRHYTDYVRFDRYFNVQTLEVEKDYLKTLDGSQAIGFEFYQATIWRRFSKSIKSLPIKNSDFTFIDLGSGKGRALMYAALSGFKKIIGIEFSSHLHKIAESNIQNFYKKKPLDCSIELVQIDATKYQFPNENLIIFMYNPFIGVTMQKVIRNLQIWSKKYNRSFYIVYMNPVAPKYIEQTTQITQLESNSVFNVYQGNTEAKNISI